mmetsp:Transcript_55/g.122  ORF Transcript_55/g.122 Transcript_55/m.122 type:complete len:169 (-) Transcript_55:1340-1846(-)
MENVLACCDSRCCGGNSNANSQNVVLTQQGCQPPMIAVPSARLCGVGIVFAVDIEGALEVASVIPGGPADECGLIQRGDILHRVNDLDVWCKSPEFVQKLVVGREGTSVRLGFSLQGSEDIVYVNLKRSPVNNSNNQSDGFSNNIRNSRLSPLQDCTNRIVPIGFVGA